MTDTATTSTGSDLLDELHAWLEANWSPDLTVAEWWERLGTAGWAAPTLPTNAYGRGLSRADAVQVQHTIGQFGALAAPGGLGLLLAAPTIAMHGTQEQIDRYVRDIVTGQKAWCQLFSEPQAGSDLAGLQTRAVKDGEQYVVNGQKVWTSGGQVADMGMLIARTNAEVPKHQGITWFAFDMHQPGVDIRPLKEMTGRAMFNEVFLTDAVAPEEGVIGGLHNGWAVTNTTLLFERAGLGAGGGSESAGAATPGTVAKHLDRPCGEFVRPAGSGGRRRGGGGPGGVGGSAGMVMSLAKATGKNTDPLVRQGLAYLHSLAEIARISNLRAKNGATIPGLPNIAKLTMSEMLRTTRDLGCQILGPAATLHGYTPEDREALHAATGNGNLAGFTELVLMAQGPQIYGGTDQIQKNIIGERVLGLPKEPGDEKTRAFKDLPKNS